jgi:hypothetical protein
MARYPRLCSGLGCRTRSFSSSGRAKNAFVTSIISDTRSADTPWPTMVKNPMSVQASAICRVTARLPFPVPVRNGATSTTGTTPALALSVPRML